MTRLAQLWQSFLGAVARVERESQQAQFSRPPSKLDGRVIGIIIVASVSLSFLEYYGGSGDYKHYRFLFDWFFEDGEQVMRDIFRRGERAELFRLTYWALATFILYFCLPALYLKLFHRESLRDYGLRIRGTLEHAWIYFAMYLVVLPAVVAVAFTEGFQKTYPFYGNAHQSVVDFLAWEGIYALQFFSLEFFFRGFLVHGLRNRFGFYAILVAVMPYCMIHFGKPLPETIGAIIAGLVLGALSLFTRSIWLGVAIHVSVAVTMDVLSMAVQGKLF